MVINGTITEADILDRVIRPQVANLHPEAARSFLQFRFDREAIRHIRQLLRKNNRGLITAAERLVLEKYLRVGQFLDLLHAKAKLAMRKNGAVR
jgi:hypothetical protein